MTNTRNTIYHHETREDTEPKIEHIEYKGNVAVLVITTHGDIQVKYNSIKEIPSYKKKVIEPEIFDIPEDMEIIGLEVVPPTVPNLLPPSSTRPFIKIIKSQTEKFNEHSTTENMIDMVNSIKKILIKLDNQAKEVEEQIKRKNTEYTDDEEIRAYYYHKALLYRVFNYKQTTLYNKRFLRENNLITNDKRSLKYFDWKLNIVNSEPYIDLMSELNPSIAGLKSVNTRSTFTATNLNKVIKYLHNKGIKKLIIIDLSCSVIRNVNRGVSSREERYVLNTDTRKRKRIGGDIKQKYKYSVCNNKTKKHR
jgi:hypothetical protein